MPPSTRLLVPLDRLDGRRHTFGTYLRGWLSALEPLVDELILTRRRVRSYPELEGLRQVEIPGWLEGQRAASLLYPLWVRRLRPTVIHYPHRFAPYSWWGLDAVKVVTVHDTALISLTDDLVARLRTRTIWRYRKALLDFDAVVTVSEASKGELCTHFELPPERVHVIYHGVDERFSPGPPPPDFAARYGLRPPFLLTVSSIKRKKNIGGLLRAFSRLVAEGRPHQLVIVGKPDDGQAEADRLVIELGLSGRVLFTGFVCGEDHPDFYRAAELLVYPSFYEGFGLPILEAMACGCPVVTSQVSSMPEVAGNAAHLVDPRDPESICAGIRHILDEPRYRASLVASGFVRAAEFTWEKAACRHAALYWTLLEGRKGVN